LLKKLEILLNTQIKRALTVGGQSLRRYAVQVKLFDRQFGPDALDSVPNAPGVYRFWSADEILYVGRAKSLKRRLTQYRTAGRRRKHRRMRAVVAQSERFTFEICPSHLEACLLEIRLIQALKPKLNIAGTFSAIYPYVGVGTGGAYLQFAYTTRPEALTDFKYFGAFRSRDICGEAYFALMRLLCFLGHPEPRRAKDVKLPRGSHVQAFRQLPEAWREAWQDFFAGRSRQALSDLSVALLEKTDARAAAAAVEEDLTALALFWREEARALSAAIETTNYAGPYPVPQAERDPLFLLWRANPA